MKVDAALIERITNGGQITNAQKKILGIPSWAKDWRPILLRMCLEITPQEAQRLMDLKPLTKAQRIDRERKGRRLAYSRDIFLDALD